MSGVLPMFFMVGSAGMLLCALYALWSSFRAAFGASDVPDLQGTIEAMSRQQLFEQKRTLLETLQDLRFDRDAGKISERDFERLDKSLRERAKDVLRLLDADVEPFRLKAEEMIKARLQDADKATPYRDADKPLVDRLECPECDTQNDTDAAFCKKCGHSFADDPEDATEDAEDGAEDQEAAAEDRLTESDESELDERRGRSEEE